MNMQSMNIGRSGGASRLPRFKPEAVISACALLAPVLAVQLVRVVSGGLGPTAASAGVTPNAGETPGMSVPVAPALPKLNERQSNALAWIKQQQSLPMAGSPLVRVRSRPAAPVTAQTPVPEVIPEPARPVEPTVPVELTKLELTSLLRLGDEARVSINGRLHRQGDEIVPGWVISEVNLIGRRVTLKNDAGVEVYLYQSR